ncbi:MAG: N-acetylmuramoyl-L-alanine amidase [Muribaculaceae bacterium]|nr:N-acetylmuramoyl-L-alanine amidase [Muribaculaceae bacterium]
MRKINKLIIHCSATPEGRAVSVSDITRWHRERGFRTIGYHYVIYLDGSVHAGRPVSEEGAHCLGQNRNSIGICYIGGLDAKSLLPKDTRTEAQKDALRHLVGNLRKEYPGATLHGHNEFAAKACPCFDVRELL